MRQLLFLLLLALPLSAAAQQRDTTWRVQYNQKTLLTHDDAQSLATPVEVKKLRFKDEFRVLFRLSDLMPKEQTLRLVDAKRQVVWEKSFDKIRDSKPPLFKGSELIKAATKGKKKLTGTFTLVVTAPELARERVLATVIIRAVEKK